MSSVIVWIGVVLIVLVVGACLWRSVQDARESARRASCIGQLKVFGLAMHNYHDAKGHFPPAYVADRNGRPAHSWRVLSLPNVATEALYQRYRFDEPWNSRHNRKLAGGLPLGMSGYCPAYHCPTDRGCDELRTSYVMAVGEDAFSAGPTGRSVNDFGDGTSNTIAIAEMSESGIHWMEPRDLDVDKMSFKVNDRKGQAIRSKHPGVVNALLADGSAHSISEDIDPHVLKALFTFAADDDAPVSDNLLR